MTSDTPDPGPMHTGRRIRWLLGVHVVLGVIAALLTCAAGIDSSLARGVYSGFLFGQTSLLGIWCGLGANGRWKRLVGGILGVCVLYLLAGLASGDWRIVLLVFLGVATAFVATPLLIARFDGILINPDSSPTAQASRLQFSIRQLLLLTFVVASVVTLGKMMHPLIWQWFSLLGVVLFAAMFFLLSVVPVWLILTTRRPVAYGIGLVAVSACSAYCVGCIISFRTSVAALICVTTAAMVVVASLLIVRRCGYRLVQLPKPSSRGSGLEEFTKPEIGNPDTQSSSLLQ